ncbi:unnamed protein product [Heligmosomoides polygyrus]|uniref:GYF_2 domain-containing protein n=1 Tax=Heligmosomoides polygyrus TaxID=6339 RepID=A0A183GW03_HELPZ|nr:unnamed protein product [Heligmosomoides polygyrus]
MRELFCPVPVTALRRNPTPFLFTLGDTDEEREAERGAEEGEGSLDDSCQRYDIRKYVLDANGRLVPAPSLLQIWNWRFWFTLGDTDEEREAERGAEEGEGSLDDSCQRYDIRKYVLDANGRLVPAPKVKIVSVGPSRERASARLKTKTKKTTTPHRRNTN